MDKSVHANDFLRFAYDPTRAAVETIEALQHAGSHPGSACGDRFDVNLVLGFKRKRLCVVCASTTAT